ncbi:MAG: GntR family transcriptional regulator [Herbinix sp.]|nr:GntR family transcriptional regulator [Herbinix sp.]
MSKNETKNLSYVVYEELKREILSLELVPGQALSENEICKKFEVSRTPVRDALWRLQEQGFVATLPYRGTYVTKLNMSEIKQLIYMRISVETNVICDFMDIATPMMLEEVRHFIRKQEAIILEKDFTPEKFYRLDSQMHEIWFEVTGKKKIWEILQAAQVHYTRYRMLDFETETNFTRIIKDHNNLFEMIKKKDKAGLTASLKEHLSYSITRMKQHIELYYKDYFEDYMDDKP